VPEITESSEDILNGYRRVVAILGEAEEEADRMYDQAVKVSNALELHPDIDYRSDRFEPVNHKLSDEEAREVFYSRFATGSLLLKRSFRRYSEKLEEFEQEYSEVSRELDFRERDKLAARQHQLENTVECLTPLMRDLDKLGCFDLDIYSPDMSAKPHRKAARSN
jgi:hypothetical protein